ncbi:hypothetical protein PSTG_11591 [Puccinia striiformis f. sp. tritici PST-78]|uniref:Capsular associated protein n=1 Tax=Puccinia striiformis f. sp. tritici PST-78 TaxID=1165861 RepID=A0A0L0V806_9BASI|nr:hypothetical protein PSTG_11591 [Puccinia striiformis f. sp. tritici PST-78]
MALSSNQRFGLRILAGLLGIWFIKSMLFSSSERNPSVESEIAIANVFERVTSGTPLGSSALNPQRYPFLQSRIGRDDTQDLFDTDIHAGLEDFWQRFQLPFATAPETIHLDEQVIKGTVEELLSFNGWAAAACTTLTRPYASDSEDPYADLTKPGQRYFFALVVHSADHFFIDQLAVVVQAARKLGTQAIFVSVVDYASTDSIPFLCDLAEAVMVLLGIPFRIRRVPPMTSDPAASYYPLEEAYTRNLALEPLFELYERRQVSFIRVIWLKGFTCPDDILETLRISIMNQAAMVCGMDWKEHNGFFIYNDRWRTRDLDGNLFRGSKSTSPIDEAPPRDAASAARYQQHLPYQVFCCESGSHIVDPMMTYYAGIHYRSSVAGVFNITSAGSGDPTQSEKVGESQADGGEKKVDQAEESTKKVTIPVEEEYGYEEEEEEEETGVLSQTSTIPNSAFKPARILVNPRCITTYAGVSHTKLALDLFGSGDDVEPSRETGGKYHFSEEKFIGAPNAFVCQEMRTTGGRLSTKQQRRTNFHISKTLRAGWRPGDYV